jgi:DNA segregation ATPase FtsK/SpoIIIE-like protein
MGDMLYMTPGASHLSRVHGAFYNSSVSPPCSPVPSCASADLTPGASHLSRVHGAFVSDDEIENVVGFLREHSQTNYLNSVVNSHSESADAHEGTGEHGGETDVCYCH